MNNSVIFALLATTVAVIAAWNNNPTVLTPKSNSCFNSGQQVPITWTGAETSHVNIELVNPSNPGLLDGAAFSIALGVPANQDQFMWTVPAGVPAGAGYIVRVWGAKVPGCEDELGNSGCFGLNDPNCPCPSSSSSSSHHRRHHGDNSSCKANKSQKNAQPEEQNFVKAGDGMTPEGMVIEAQNKYLEQITRQHQQDLLNVLRQQREQKELGKDFIPIAPRSALVQPQGQQHAAEHQEQGKEAHEQAQHQDKPQELKDVKEAISIVENHEGAKKSQDTKKDENFVKLKPKTDLPRLNVESIKKEENKQIKKNAASSINVTSALLIVSVIVAALPSFF